VSDLAAASRFYEAALTPLGYTKLEERATTVGFGKRYAEHEEGERRQLH